MGFRALFIGRTNITIQEVTVSRKKYEILSMLFCKNTTEVSMSLCPFNFVFLFLTLCHLMSFLKNSTILSFFTRKEFEFNVAQCVFH